MFLDNFSLPPSDREEDEDILWLFEEDAQLIATTFVTVFICISSKPLIKPGSCLCCPSSKDNGNAGRTISPSGRGHSRASDQTLAQRHIQLDTHPLHGTKGLVERGRKHVWPTGRRGLKRT